MLAFTAINRTFGLPQMSDLPDDEVALADAPRKNALRSEVGATGVEFFRGTIVTGEFNADLKGTKAAKTYDKMRRTDAQINAILSVMKLPVKSATWSVEAEDEDVQEFLIDALFERLDFQRLLSHLLTALDFGYVVLEKVYEMDGSNLWLKKIAFRGAETIWEWEVDENDELAGIIQRARKGGTYLTIPIPVEKLVHMAINQEGNNFTGISILRSAYKHWFIKDGIYRVDAIAHERFGIGVPVMRAPEGYTEDDEDAARAMMKNYRAGEKAEIFEPPGWEFRIEGTGDSARYDPLPAIKHHDEMISRNVLAQFLNLGTTESGSRSLGESMTDLYMFSLRSVADLIVSTIKKQIINPLLALNFSGDHKASLRYADMDTRPPAEIATALKTFTDAQIIHPDEDLEDWARDIIDAPARMEEGMNTNAASERHHNGHIHLNDYGYGQMEQMNPGGFWRPLRQEEKTVSLREIEGRQEDALNQTVEMFAPVKAQWTASLLDQIAEALSDGDPSDIGAVTVPRTLKTPLEAGMRDLLRDLYAFGRRTVREELKRQTKRRPDVALREDDLDNQELTALLRVRTNLFLDRVAEREKGVAVDRALSIYRTKGKQFSVEDLFGLRTEMKDLADSTVRNEARKTVSEAFSLGRQKEAEGKEEQIQYAIYSAILDGSVCPECAPLDGRQFQLGTPDYYEFAPPNRRCLGGNRCRCMYVYVMADEQKARA